MRNRLKSVVASLGLGASFALGASFVLLLLFAVGRGQQILSNPFGFSTQITPSGPVVLMQVQKLARLETARYRGQAIVKGDTSSGFFPAFVAGDRLVFVGHGEVVAGVDLAKMQEGDVTVKDNVATVKLPAAEIFHTRLDNAQSEVFERQTGIFSQPDRDLESKTRLEAENRILQAATESGLLKNADLGAREALQKHLMMLGFKEVLFR
jgi:hypothetical protein